MGSTETFVSNEIDQALRKHRLPPDSPLREELKRNAYVGGGYSPVVRTLGNSNREMTLDQRIEEMRCDPRFSHHFPAEKPRISQFDQDAIRDNFEAIRRGEVEVK